MTKLVTERVTDKAEKWNSGIRVGGRRQDERVRVRVSGKDEREGERSQKGQQKVLNNTQKSTYAYNTVLTSWNDSNGSFCLLGQTRFPLNASTISRASHRVPVEIDERGKKKGGEREERRGQEGERKRGVREGGKREGGEGKIGGGRRDKRGRERGRGAREENTRNQIKLQEKRYDENKKMNMR